VLGFRLMENFNTPYYSLSISEFWRRWHISLSTWFKDYLYIPLGGNRVSKRRHIVNLLITFSVSGLWHGANWTFVIWGAIHGAVLATSQLFFTKTIPGAESRVVRALKVLVTFHVVVLAWVFFRAESVSKALYVLTHLFSHNGASRWAVLPETPAHLVLCVFAIVAVEALESWVRAQRSAAPNVLVSGLRYAVALGIAVLVLFRLTDDRGPQQFIYFQF